MASSSRRAFASSQVNDYALHLGVLLEALMAALAAEAGLLEAAERDLVRVAGGVVGADQAVLELLGHAHETRRVLRVEVGGQAEGGVVGAPDDLLFGVEEQDGRGRAEDLLDGDGHVV